jgi:hypothetical protein
LNKENIKKSRVKRSKSRLNQIHTDMYMTMGHPDGISNKQSKGKLRFMSPEPAPEVDPDQPVTSLLLWLKT